MAGSIQLTLDGDALREATVQAMIGVLTPEAQKQVIDQAIRAILSPSTNSWERSKSPIELAFEAACQQVARAEAQRLVAEDGELRQRINDLLRQTADKLLAVDVEKLAERMADSLAASMRNRD